MIFCIYLCGGFKTNDDFYYLYKDNVRVRTGTLQRQIGKRSGLSRAMIRWKKGNRIFSPESSHGSKRTSTPWKARVSGNIGADR